MVHYVYKTTVPDGRFYIGCHKTEKNYFDDKYLGSGKLLRRYIKENGREGIKKSVIGIFMDRNEANQYEVSQQKRYLEISPELCLFTAKSFSDARNLGRKASVETKRKMSKAQKIAKQVVSAETRAKMSESALGEKNPFYGKKHTEETKEKMSRAHMKRRPTDS